MLGIHWACICVMAAVFGYAGIIKLLDPQSFSLAVYRYHLIPDQIVNLFSLWLAGFEVVSAIALFCSFRIRLTALYFQIVLLSAFSAGIAISILRGSQMSCGCLSLSPTQMPVSVTSIVKNIGLVLLASYAICSFKLLKTRYSDSVFDSKNGEGNFVYNPSEKTEKGNRA